MKRDPEQLLDGFLILWANLRPPLQPAYGYKTSSPGTERFATSRQYDYGPGCNGAGYDDEELALVKAVAREIESLDSSERAAIEEEARALMVGARVFISPRLTREQAAKALASAKTKLVVRLRGAGLM